MATTASSLELRIEKSDDANQPYILRAYDTGQTPERKIAYSETYKGKASAQNAADLIVAGQYHYTTFEGTDKRWYWRLTGLNNEKVVRSATHCMSKDDAGWRESWLKQNRAGATIVDCTTPVA